MEFNPIAITIFDFMVPKQPGDVYGDAVNQPALPGQNTAPPSEKVFVAHFIVKPTLAGLAAPYYDPSYGVTYAGANDFENVAVEGYLKKFAVDADNVYRVKDSAGLMEINFNK